MSDFLARARAPLRLGLAGGGTDVSPYSDRFGGYVLNVTIDKYAYATVAPRHDGQLSLCAADTGFSWTGPARPRLEPQAGLDLHVGVYNRIVREFNGGHPLALSVTTHSEVPPGSGLGSSSTMVVALLQAFREFLSLPLGQYETAHLAYEIERVDLGMLGGRQDQYAATFGGLNFMEFYQDRVIVNPLRIKADIKAELEASLVLLYTGVARESAEIIARQSANVVQGDAESLQALHHVKREAVKMKESVLRGDFDSFVASMRAGWESKKRMADRITNPAIDATHDAAIAAGALAGRVSGAGGGGFMIFFVDPPRRPQVMRALAERKGQVFTCTFSEQGAQSWRKT